MKKRKLKLSQLKVKSFTTSEIKSIKGGTKPQGDTTDTLTTEG